jgi:hypothetical protein
MGLRALVIQTRHKAALAAWSAEGQPNNEFWRAQSDWHVRKDEDDAFITGLPEGDRQVDERSAQIVTPDGATIWWAGPSNFGVFIGDDRWFVGDEDDE